MCKRAQTHLTRAGVLLATSLVIVLSSSGVAPEAQSPPASWPQWGGPTRNFHVESTSIVRTWPESGPRQRWRHPLGEGYSSILAEGDILVTMYRRGDDEVIIALDAATGTKRWEHAYSAPLVHNGYFDVWLNAAGPGPYSTPLIADGTVFSVGVNGHFHALDLRTGALRWSHNLAALFKLSDYNAFASSPLAYGNNVILPLGGSRHGVVAFKRDTGALAWQGEPLALAPGSPVLIDVEGQKQLVVWCQQELAGVSPDNGRVLWRHAHPTQLGLNISTPLWVPGNRLFASSAYGGGSRVIQLTRANERTTTKEVWFNNRMHIHFGGALRMGNLIIGTSGDFGPAFMVAVKADTGEEVWRDRTFARAQMVDAGGTLVIVDEHGEIALASISDDKLHIHARKTILAPNAWTPPTIVGSTMYVRDRKDILALELGK